MLVRDLQYCFFVLTFWAKVFNLHEKNIILAFSLNFKNYPFMFCNLVFVNKIDPAWTKTCLLSVSVSGLVRPVPPWCEIFARVRLQGGRDQQQNKDISILSTTPSTVSLDEDQA